MFEPEVALAVLVAAVTVPLGLDAARVVVNTVDWITELAVFFQRSVEAANPVPREQSSLTPPRRL